MGNSLFDQLKKSGLIDAKKAKKIKHHQHKEKNKKLKKGTQKPLSVAAKAANKVQYDKIAHDKEINKALKNTLDKKAVHAQIKQLIESNRIKDGSGEVVYNFVDDSVVKRIFISDKVHRSLVNGQLMIAKFEHSYEVIPARVAEKIKRRDEYCIIVSNYEVDAGSSNDDDIYSKYTVPDDLMW